MTKRSSSPLWKAFRLVFLYAFLAAVCLFVWNWSLMALVPDAVSLPRLQTIALWGLGLSAGGLIGFLVYSNLLTTERMQQYLHLLTESTSDYILTYNLDRRLIFVNRPLTTTSSYDVAALYATEMQNALHPEDRASVQEQFAAVFEGRGTPQVEFRVLSDGGTMHWVRASWGPLRDAEQRIVAVWVNHRDITAAKELEEQLRQTQLRLVQSEKLATLGQLVAGVAHEINNPLTTTLGLTQMLLDTIPGFSSQVRADLITIENQTQRASRIVGNLLAFARKRASARVATDLNDAVMRTLELRTYYLRTHGIELELRLAPCLITAMADPYELQQVILNLLINAEQALTDAAWRAQTLHPPRLIIETDHHQEPGTQRELVVIRISDNGPGIDPALRDQIFEPFFTTKSEAQGTGLGLTIAADIIRNHEGILRVESASGGATTFEIILPAAANDKQPDPPRDVTSLPMGVRVLIVDDEGPLRDLLIRALNRFGLEADAVADGREALAALQQHSYSLLICDLYMPGMSGMGLYEAVTRQFPHLSQKIIFITGDSMSAESREFLSASQCVYLTKPFDIRDLIARISQILPSHSRAAGQT